MLKFVCLLGIFFYASSGAGKTLKSDRLWYSVMRDYNKNQIPLDRPGTSPPIKVTMGISLIKLVSFENGVLTLDTWFSMEWNDQRLTWKAYDFDNISSLRIPHERLWIPDIIAYNRASGNKKECEDNINTVVTSDGNVTFIPPRRVSAHCYNYKDRVEAGKYSCILRFGSWVYDTGYLDPQLLSQSVYMHDHYPNENWSVTNATLFRKEYKYSCCPNPFVNIEMVIEFTPA